MGFDLDVEGIEALNDSEIEEVRKKHTAYLACEAAEIRTPVELYKYFEDLGVYPTVGVSFEAFLKGCGKTYQIYSLRGKCSEEFGEFEGTKHAKMYLIDLSKLPKRTKFIRIRPSP